MYIRILNKDIKRKKAMNIILSLFMIVASMLIASSTNLLYTTTTALQHFKQVSETSDNLIVTFSSPDNDRRMLEWSSKCSKVKEINSEDMILVQAENIKLSAEGRKLEDGATLTVAKVPLKNNLVFNERDELFRLNAGEVALPNIIRDSFGLKIGDTVKISIGGVEKELRVGHFLKDVLFGSGLMGLKRIIVSDEDFGDFYGTADKSIIKLWSVIKTETATYEEVEKEFNKTSISSISIFNSDTISYTYIMDLTTAAIMSILSIFLILISFLILRFTIRFTIEEDYKEIGIMKAVGLKNRAIKNLYLVKYFAIALLGGSLGFAASIPFSGFLRDNISQNIMMTTGILNYFLAGLSSVLIIAATLLFCYLCTGRINKMTAIDAIRQGSNGERFSASSRLKLHSSGSISTPVFMAVSDLVTGFRKFIVLMVTFILGTLIIIVPINDINTLASDDVVTLFGLAKSDFNLRPDGYGVVHREASVERLMDYTHSIEQEMNKNGFDVDIHPEIILTAKVYAGDPNDSMTVLGLQAYDYSTDNYVYLKGTPPRLENELALTEKAADYFGIGIGDNVNCIGREGSKKYIVTAMFQSMNNLGYSLRFSEKHIMDMLDSSAFTLFGEFNNKENKAEQLKALKDKFPELKIRNSREYVDSFMGNISGQIDVIKTIILIIVLSINFLITCLLVRMLITKETADIALLKAVGFRNRDIRKWQAVRIMIILLVSVIIGTLLANLTGSYLSSGIFGFMGATQIKLTIEPLQVYLLYPLIILAVTMTAVLISLGQVKSTNIWEINNQE